MYGFGFNNYPQAPAIPSLPDSGGQPSQGEMGTELDKRKGLIRSLLGFASMKQPGNENLGSQTPGGSEGSNTSGGGGGGGSENFEGFD